MSKPSFSNIDLWLFELAEGNLSEAQVKQLELFLLQHPELDVDKDAWKMARVEKDPSIVYDAEKHERRRPVGFYLAMSATAVCLLGIFGFYHYFNADGNSISLQTAEVTASHGTGRTTQHTLKDERAAEGTAVAEMSAEIEELQLENRQLSALLSQQSEALKNANDRVSNSAALLQNAYAQLESATRHALSYANNEFEHGSDGDLASNATSVTQNQEETVSDKLEPLAPSYFETGYEGISTYASDHKSTHNKFSSDEVKFGFKTKLDRLARSFQRMMDNPVALKNTRDPHYHLPGSMATDVNFGAVGTLLTTRIETLSRIHWMGSDQENLVNKINVDGYSYGIRGGVGLQLSHSMFNQGGIHTADAMLTYSPKFSVSRGVSVEPAIRLKMGGKVLDHSKMEGQEQIEIDRGNVYSYYQSGQTPIGKSLVYKDLGLGVMVNTKWFFVGIQGDNLLHHKENIYDTDFDTPRVAPTEVVATIGTDWESKKENMSLSPYLIYRNYGALNEAWAGISCRWGWARTGVSVSSNLDLAASLGLQFKHFSLNYQADYTHSVLMNQPMLSHQIALRYRVKMSRVGQRILSL